MFPSSGTCSVTIQFAPLAPGTRLGAIDILGATDSSSTPTSQATVYLHGIGIAPVLAFDGAGLINTLQAGATKDDYFIAVTVDAAGAIYSLNENNCTVYKFPAGTNAPTIVAGSGVCSASASNGDGGPATNAVFRTPYRLAMNGRGDIYVADSYVHVIRKVDGLTGIISTIAGTFGQKGYTADGALAVHSMLNIPEGLTVDGAGNLYFSDAGNSTYRKINARSGVLTTVAEYSKLRHVLRRRGLATKASIQSSASITRDSIGNLYITDQNLNSTNNGVVRKISADTGIIETIAGGGLPATEMEDRQRTRS